MMQGTAEWTQARVGKVTASRITDMMATTKTGGWGAGRKNYAAELVAERLTGEPAPRYTNGTMAYALEIEPEARTAYSRRAWVDVAEVGFVPHPTIADAGASPDGLVGDDGLVEIKCPNTATHIETLLRGDKIDSDYVLQMQFQMACTGRQWCDFVSYDKRLPPGRMRLFIVRVYRDPKMIADIEAAVRVFSAEVDATVAALTDRYAVEVAA
jgi:putative phage-type endonuclease